MRDSSVESQWALVIPIAFVLLLKLLSSIAHFVVAPPRLQKDLKTSPNYGSS
jgi:hypothetical protein